MKRLLAPQQAALLASLARQDALLAFDFDGTLAPLVANHAEAQMASSTRALLTEVCLRYPSVVISGRGRDDVTARLGGARLTQVIGNHGLEPGGDLERFAAETARVRQRLERGLIDAPNVEIEDKRYSLAVHYRGRAPRRVRRLIDQVIEEFGTMRTILGKHVINLVPVDATDKGEALLQLMTELRASTALYVGDDITDEDVFSLRRPELLTVRIGQSRTSAADYYLRNQPEIDHLLQRLLTLRG